MVGTFDTKNFMTLEQATQHVEDTLPRQVGKCCGNQNDGFRCTLFKGHSGDHEAYGIGHILYHSWHNCNDQRAS